MYPAQLDRIRPYPAKPPDLVAPQAAWILPEHALRRRERWHLHPPQRPRAPDSGQIRSTTEDGFHQSSLWFYHPASHWRYGLDARRGELQARNELEQHVGPARFPDRA